MPWSSFVRRSSHCTTGLRLGAVLAIVAAVARPGLAQTAPAEQTFTIFARGQDIGSEQVSVTRTPEGWLVTGSGRLNAPLDLTVQKFEMRYDADWRPIALSVQGSARGDLLDVRTRFEGGVARTDLTVGAANTSDEQEVAPEAIVLMDSFFGAYEALAARLGTMQPGETIPIFLARQGQLGLRLDRIEPERIQTPSRHLDTRRYQVTFLARDKPTTAEVWSDGAGRLLRVSFPSFALQAVRDDVATAATRIQTVTRAGDEEVRITGAGFTISATVSQPAGPAPATGYPAIVLVPGAGPADRDEVTSGIPIYGQLAGDLGDAGYLVVRFDKRGVGLTGGRQESATLTDFADDVVAVVRYLRDRKGIDDRRIAVLGYGDGGWIAMLAASRENRIAALALVATPGGTGEDLILARQRQALDGLSLAEPERNEKVELQKKINAAVLSGEGWDALPADVRRQADTATFRSLLAFDPAEPMRRARQPTLVLRGAADALVTAEAARRLAELGSARKDRRVLVVEVPGVDHLLVARESDQAAGAQSLGPAVAASVGRTIVEWLKNPYRATLTMTEGR